MRKIWVKPKTPPGYFIECSIVGRTVKAVHVSIAGRMTWIPKSAVTQYRDDGLFVKPWMMAQLARSESNA